MSRSYLLSIFLFIQFLLSAQTELVRISRELNLMPSISGVQEGEIPFYSLCSTDGLQTRDSIKIISFTIQYTTDQGEFFADVKGNRIPDSICAQIGRGGIGNFVFITQILGKSKTNKNYLLWSMTLIATRNDE